MRIRGSRPYLWGIVAGNVFIWWLVRLLSFRPYQSDLVQFVAFVVFVSLLIGTVWMICHCWVHEENHWRYILASVVPWVFVWYYLTRARKPRPAGGPLLPPNSPKPSTDADIAAPDEQTTATGQGPSLQDASQKEERNSVGSPARTAMKFLTATAWVCFLCATTAFPLWIFWATIYWGIWIPKRGLETDLLGLFFGIHPFGALWMLLHSITHERRPIAFILLTPLPYSFVWYYFERVHRVRPPLS